MEGCPSGIPGFASWPVELLKLMLTIQKQTVQGFVKIQSNCKNLFRINLENMGQSWSSAPIIRD